MRKLCVFSLLALLSFAAYGADDNPVVLHGFDKMSCTDWASSRSIPPSRQLYVAWIRGIVTGYNYANPNNQVALGKMPDDVMLEIYVDDYCREHPSFAFAGAAFALIEEARVKPGPAAKPVPKPVLSDEEAFKEWLQQQSADMQSLDIDVLHKIYKKETVLNPK